MKKKNKSHGVQLLLRMVVKDSDGKVLSDTGQNPSKSFVIAFLNYVYCVMTSLQPSVKDVTNTLRTQYGAGAASKYFFRCGTPANNSTWGIVLGTGDTAEDNEDYALETQLTQGVGVGNITHGAMIIGSSAVVGVNVDLELKRTFTNNTGSSIIVKEAGIYTWNEANNYYFMIIRDVLSPSKTVPDKCSLTVYYTFRTTV